ncbi:aminotransferase class I/II-fold pyridoxal phosphate-dependent enzyme [Abyssicoccus albus]|uniref:aminotransferase class I/II-fold pyridoxal phosphate-dependent enzyme n=1 Tax=Abyssicoccus albus TaxID=1817405 RepID=UPI00097E20B6|nr:aminotransferase class I/II-fold pyridoxal phosphate-dependent enzyme [Abyssicoccus albus]AQL56960.1 hypothetical protein BVH56_08585 [Abyssicoccus albus]
MNYIHQYLNNRNKDNRISFHVPGHHNGTIGNLTLNSRSDITELSDSDDLHDANGIIKQSMMQYKYFFPSYTSHYLVNGTTSGIMSAIYGILHHVEKPSVLIIGAKHKSIDHGLKLVKASGDYIKTSSSDDDLLSSISNSLEQNEYQLVIVTNPTYEGYSMSIEKVIKLVQSKNIPTMVDEAHGAHMILDSDYFGRSATEFNADIVVQSFHKTLPTLTGSSMIHIHDVFNDKFPIEYFLSVFQTSSPSYLMMESLDQCFSFMKEFDIHYFKEQFEKLLNMFHSYGFKTFYEDPVKVRVEYKSYLGKQIEKAFYNRGIDIEYSKDQYVLLIIPLFQRGHHFPIDRLSDILKKVVNDIESYQSKLNRSSNVDVEKNQSFDFSLGFQLTSLRELVTIDDSLGRINLLPIIPYPPGQIFLQSGDEITNHDIIEIKRMIHDNKHVQNIIDGGYIYVRK